MNIAFFIRHFTERGTEIAVYDYAHFNETILNNKSIIVCFTPQKQESLGWPMTRISYEKFKSRFPIVEISDISEMSRIIETHKLDIFYTLTHGSRDIYEFENKQIWGSCKTIKHCVFDTTYPEGDFYISISNHLNKSANTNISVIPHIVYLPECIENLRNELQIPTHAIVLGRYGGKCQFDMKITHDAIAEFLQHNTNTYFLFMNTYKFYEHPRIIYLDGTTDMISKVKFINTCDAMIHARSIGETFGLSIAEFSSKNKPVITCPCGDLEHTTILGDKAILYHSKDELIRIFINIREIITSRDDWNAYKKYTPEHVMKLFHTIIFSS
jgi:hypothetical protein